MMTAEHLEQIRRSAAMAPLSESEVLRLIEYCDRLLRERQQIAAALGNLPTTVSNLRATLNELHRIVGDAGHPSTRKGRQAEA